MSDIHPRRPFQMCRWEPREEIPRVDAQHQAATTLSDMGPDGDAHVFHVTFTSRPSNSHTGPEVKQIMGQWKVTGIELVAAEPTR